MYNVILNCSNRFLSPVFKHNSKVACICTFDVFGTRLISNTRHTGCLYRSCLAAPRYFSACHNYRTTRYFSDLLKEDTLSKENSPKTPLDFNIDALVSLLRQENAADICVIKVPDEIKYTEYFIVVSGSSTRHLRAMALYAIKMHKFMRKDGDSHANIEGKDAEDWMCVDFGSMVVHFMLPEARALYELENLWTLRSFDEQLSSIPPETLPEDYMYVADVTK